MLLSDIGEGSNALFCLTDRTQCCTTEAGDARGSWRFPNGSLVNRDDADLSFYAIRGYSSIHLNRRSDVVAPTGIFICRLPDEATGSGMYLIIGAYDDASEGVLGMNYNYLNHYYNNTAINITGNRVFQLGETTAITCSTPVPVQSIQWLDESNSVVREGTSVQELVLDISIAASHSNTEFTCRGSFHGGLTASDTITIRSIGMKITFQSHAQNCIILFIIIVPSVSVAVTESGEGAIAGQNYTLECGVSGADILADVSITYEWTRGSSSVVLGGDMTYTFTPTAAGDDGVMYDCAVTVTSSSLSTPITRSGSRTISVLGMH